MFIEVEGEDGINLDLVEKVEMRHAKKVATLRVAGAPQISDSAIAYTYFRQNPDLWVKIQPVPCPKCGVEVRTYADLEFNHTCAVTT